MNILEQDEIPPFTWAKLKEVCNKLSDEQLTQTVMVIQEDSSIEILSAEELGSDHYLFDNDNEYSVSKEDFDPEYHLDGKYKTLEEAIEKEPHTMTPGTNVYLFERF